MTPKEVFSRLAGEYSFNFHVKSDTFEFDSRGQSNSILLFNQQVLSTYLYGLDDVKNRKLWMAQSLISFNNIDERFERLWIESDQKGAQRLYFGHLEGYTLVFMPAETSLKSEECTTITYNFHSEEYVEIVYLKSRQNLEVICVNAKLHC